MNQELIDRPKILIVDDQEINVFILKTIFEGEYQVTVVDNGAAALELCRSDPPDLVLLDVLMPGLGGLEVCRRLKANEDSRDIPVIFVTSQDHPEEETEALGAGGVDFITKPVNASVVRARVRTQITLKRQSDFLRSQVFTDPLTGIANRRRFDEGLEYEWNRGVRKRTPLALFMIDIDNFKTYNDTFGHAAGDSTLRLVAQTLKSGLLRSQDLLARYGGEEFVCLIPEATWEGSETLAQRLVHAVEASGGPTVSLGYSLALPVPGLRPSQLLAAADRLLYRAKRQGKNRAVGELYRSLTSSDTYPTPSSRRSS